MMGLLLWRDGEERMYLLDGCTGYWSIFDTLESVPGKPQSSARNTFSLSMFDHSDLGACQPPAHTSTSIPSFLNSFLNQTASSRTPQTS